MLKKSFPLLITFLVALSSLTSSANNQAPLKLKPITNAELKLKLSVPESWDCARVHDEDDAQEDDDVDEIEDEDETDITMICGKPGDEGLYLMAFSGPDEKDAYPDSTTLWTEWLREKIWKNLDSDDDVKVLPNTISITPGHENGIAGSFISMVVIVSETPTKKVETRLFGFGGKNKDRIYLLVFAAAVQNFNPTIMELCNRILDTFDAYELSFEQMVKEIQGTWNLTFDEDTSAILQVNEKIGTLKIRVTEGTKVTQVEQNVTVLRAAEYKNRDVKDDSKFRGLYLRGSTPLLSLTGKPATGYSTQPDELLIQKRLDGSYNVFRSFQGLMWDHAKVNSYTKTAPQPERPASKPSPVVKRPVPSRDNKPRSKP